jgi:hypothetical protein
MAPDPEKQVVEKASSAELGNGAAGVVLDAETNKKLLRRIDWRVMPVVSSHSLPFLAQPCSGKDHR